VQSALPVWLEGRGEIQKQIRERTQANLAELDRQILKLPAAERLVTGGGWYAIVRIPAVQPDELTVLELLEKGVWVHPGYFFGLPSSGWLVMSLLTPVEEFSTGVTRLVDFLGTNQKGNRTDFPDKGMVEE
jgi:alanine-synthesizing transaminase